MTDKSLQYNTVGSLLDLQVGKVYFRNGKAYLIEDKVDEVLYYRVDDEYDEEISLDKASLETYLDCLFSDDEDELFFKLQ